MDSTPDIDAATALALLEWQRDMGVDDAIGTAPVNRYTLAAKAPKPKGPAPAAAPAPPPRIDPVAEAEAAANAARDLSGLQAALAAYAHCDLRNGARNLVFADGKPGARVMIVGEAPGRDEDLAGTPFVGQAGQLLDKMFAAIGLSRSAETPDQSLYITNVLPWRPPQNRDPKPEEIAMMQPFLARHIALAEPQILIVMGNHACRAALGKTGITRLRGAWTTSFGRPTLPMFHPAYLLRHPGFKREAWADLLALQERLTA